MVFHTWNDIVVEGPCDPGWWDATDPTGQQEAFTLVEGHVAKQLSEDRVGADRQGDCSTVLADDIGGDTRVSACVVRLGARERQPIYVFITGLTIYRSTIIFRDRPNLSDVDNQLPRGQEGVLPCALTQRCTILLPGQVGLRDALRYTHKLGLSVFHNGYILL